MRKSPLLRTGLVSLVLALLVVACGGGSVGARNLAGATSVMSVSPDAAATGPYTRNFNPFVPTAVTASGNAALLVYEPLLLENDQTQKLQPWLATSYQWGDGGKQLTLHLRDAVKWSNGQPFTAQDVAFTFNLMKQYPAANTQGIPIAGAAAQGSSTVVLHFSGPAYVYLVSIGNVDPVPQAQWQAVGDPATYQDSSPVGTGPYVISSFTPQVITLAKNPSYWQANKIKIARLRYLSFDSTESMMAALETNQIQWASQKFPSGVTPFTSRDPQHNKVGSLEGAANVLIPNTQHYPLSLVAARKAISDALNRTAISKLGENGVNPPVTSPTGLNPGSQKSSIAPDYRKLRFKTGASVAKQDLESAGFKLGDNGIFNTPKGTPFSINVVVSSGAPGFLMAAQLIQTQLKAAGIQLTIKSEAAQASAADIAQGNFDLAFQVTNNQAVLNPFWFYEEYMDSNQSAPLGHKASLDLGRFADPDATKLLSQYSGAAPGSSAQQQALYGLEKIQVQQVVVIPEFWAVFRGEFSTAQFTGWPQGAKAYAPPLAYQSSVLEVVQHLRAGA